MARRESELRKETRIEALKAEIRGVQFVHVRTTIEIYDRNPNTGDAELVETRPDLDLLIDPGTGFRRLRSATNAEAWDDAAKGSKLVHIPITCHRLQLEMILDTTTRVIGVISGQRAGKTHALAFWMLRQWMIKGGGGDGALFWWVAPLLSQTQIGVSKLFRGDGDRIAPVFPAELVRYLAKSFGFQYVEAFTEAPLAGRWNCASSSGPSRPRVSAS